jgi:arsenate reductase (thioredoxin)
LAEPPASSARPRSCTSSGREAYAKPLSPEVVGAADVIVTMGRSVGAVEIPESARREDWRVGDPTGAPVEEVRRVRDEIDGRVQALLAKLESVGAER